MATPRDFKIDLNTSELVFENGDLVMVEGADAIRQAIFIRLRFFLGEWFLDESAGCDWHGSVLGRKYNAAAVEAVVSKALLETPGVASVISIDPSFDSTTRTVSVAWSVSTDFGKIDGTTPLPV